MKLAAFSVFSFAALVLGTRLPRAGDSAQVVISPSTAEEPQYLIEFRPGETQWVTESEKWEIRRVCAILPYDILMSNDY